MPSTDDVSEPRADILLIDDEPANLLALENILADLGQNLVRAPSGDEALRLLHERDFAVVPLDLRMSSVEGFKTAQQIRGVCCLGNLVLFSQPNLSGNSRPGHFAWCALHGIAARYPREEQCKHRPCGRTPALPQQLGYSPAARPPRPRSRPPGRWVADLL
jgi:Response regulator receiver domain